MDEWMYAWTEVLLDNQRNTEDIHDTFRINLLGLSKVYMDG